MATSVFQNFRAALATAITTRFTTDAVTGVTVTQYPPLGEIGFEDRVWIDEITVEQEPLTMGGTGRQVDEDMRVGVRVQVGKPGGDLDDVAACEVRAETIWNSVQNALRADSDVSSSVMFAEVESFSSVPWAQDQRVGILIEAVIHAKANI